MGLGAKPQNVAYPTVNQTGQESGRELCGEFQILIVLAVKICQQCLQTATVSGGFRLPDLLPGLRPCTPLGKPPPRSPGLIAPSNKNFWRRHWPSVERIPPLIER